MREAFVCINASPSSVEEVFEEVKAYQGVREAFRVHGVYDIIARVSGETFEELNHIVNDWIKRLGEVQTILSMLLLESEKPVGDGKLLLVWMGQASHPPFFLFSKGVILANIEGTLVCAYH